MFEEAKELWRQNKIEESIALTEKVVSNWERLKNKNLKLHGIKLAKARVFFSEILDKEDEFRSTEEANKAFQICIELINLVPTQFGSESINLLTQLSNRLHEKGESNAIDKMKEVIEHQKQLLQSGIVKEEDLAKNVSDLSNWLIERENYPEAIEYIKKAIRTYRNLTPRNKVSKNEMLNRDIESNKVELANCLITLSECQFEINASLEARNNATEAVEIYKSLHKEFPQKYTKETAKSYNALLDILAKDGISRKNKSFRLAQEAEKFFNQLSKVDSYQYNLDLARVINLINGFIADEKNNSNLSATIKKQERAVEIFNEAEKSSTTISSDLAYSLFILSKLLVKTKNLPKAKEVAFQAYEMSKKLGENIDEIQQIINLSEDSQRKLLIKGRSKK